MWFRGSLALGFRVSECSVGFRKAVGVSAEVLGQFGARLGLKLALPSFDCEFSLATAVPIKLRHL